VHLESRALSCQRAILQIIVAENENYRKPTQNQISAVRDTQGSSKLMAFREEEFFNG
jgi:hypothetical protein